MHLVFLIALIGSGFLPPASAAEMLEVERRDSFYHTQKEIIERLRPTALQPLRVGQYRLTDVPAGSHLRILYSSSREIPLTIELLGSTVPDMLTAYLPPQGSGEVLIPLLWSSGWNRSQQGVLIHTYAIGESAELIGAGVEDHADFLERFTAYLRHLTYGENFRFSSINLLPGYRIAGYSVTILIGCVLTLIVIGLALRRRNKALGSVITLCVTVLLLYQARFLIDIARATFHDQRMWSEERTFNELGDIYAIAHALAQEEVTEVTVCGRLLSPLSYLLYPKSTKPAQENWQVASHAVLLPPVYTGDGMITCEKAMRPGKILQTFPDGGVLASFLEP